MKTFTINFATGDFDKVYAIIERTLNKFSTLDWSISRIIGYDFLTCLVNRNYAHYSKEEHPVWREVEDALDDVGLPVSFSDVLYITRID
jgi:hypothetical protein